MIRNTRNIDFFDLIGCYHFFESWCVVMDLLSMYSSRPIRRHRLGVRHNFKRCSIFELFLLHWHLILLHFLRSLSVGYGLSPVDFYRLDKRLLFQIIEKDGFFLILFFAGAVHFAWAVQIILFIGIMDWDKWVCFVSLLWLLILNSFVYTLNLPVLVLHVV